MVNKTVHAVYAETYDLNTAVGELSILGVHTPQSDNLKKIFHGFFEQYRRFRILGCNIKMVCPSQQLLDPSQMGLEAGQVDPRDVLNPILFKAVTGEGMNTILDLAYNPETEVSGSSLSQTITDNTDALAAYYGFLADETFRKFHPQRGLEVSHLVPMVHKVVTTQPFKFSGVASTYDENPNIAAEMGGDENAVYGFGSPGNAIHPLQNAIAYGENHSVFVSDGVTPMPWLDTAVPQSDSGVIAAASYGLVQIVPRVFMGAIILPPAILQRLYFRMTIVWHIEFKDFRHATELGYPGTANSENVGGFGNAGYYNIYHTATPDTISKDVSSFSTTESVEISEVMTKGL